jgi:DNA-binding GntR family transcriptional regulator
MRSAIADGEREELARAGCDFHATAIDGCGNRLCTAVRNGDTLFAQRAVSVHIVSIKRNVTNVLKG